MKRVENDEIDELPPSFEQVSNASSTPQPAKQSNAVPSVPTPVKRTGLRFFHFGLKSRNGTGETPTRPKSR